MAYLQSLTLSKQRFQPSCFLVNFAKFRITPFLKNSWDGCFWINTDSVHCPTTTFVFSETMSHEFSRWVFSQLDLQTGNKSELNISIFTRKHLCWSLVSYENICARVSFLMKVHIYRVQLYQKRNFSTGFSLWILQNFS